MARAPMLGISISPRIGLGDGLQFSSLPENFFRATGEKLVDVSKPWFFDFNPYVVRDVEPEKTIELWNFGPTLRPWPRPRPHVYLSNAEIHAAMLGVPVVLNRPRLYRFEDVKFEDRKRILLHAKGRSNGDMPERIVEHVKAKYGGLCLYQIGLQSDPGYGIEKLYTPTFWDLAREISSAKMFIGVDSGPSWIAACYPDIVAKKVRVKLPDGEGLIEDWVPLEIDRIHSHWDDRCFHIHNVTEDDRGFTSSFKRL